MASRRAKKRALTVASMTLPRTPESDAAASTSFATPGSDVFGRRAQQEALQAIDGSQSLEAAAHVREHPLARRSQDARTRGPPTPGAASTR